MSIIFSKPCLTRRNGKHVALLTDVHEDEHTSDSRPDLARPDPDGGELRGEGGDRWVRPGWHQLCDVLGSPRVQRRDGDGEEGLQRGTEVSLTPESFLSCVSRINGNNSERSLSHSLP